MGTGEEGPEGGGVGVGGVGELREGKRDMGKRGERERSEGCWRSEQYENRVDVGECRVGVCIRLSLNATRRQSMNQRQ